IRTRNGSPSRSAMTASAVGFHVGAVRRRPRITALIATLRPRSRRDVFACARAGTPRTLPPPARPVNLDSPRSVGDPPRRDLRRARGAAPVTLPRTLAGVGVAAWLGIIAFFSFEVAPVVFKTIDRAIAGQAVTAVLPRYYRWGLALSGVALVASALQAIS